jgi:hypothetical protein
MTSKSIVDTIIQGAAVDLFHTLDIAAAPLPPVRGQRALDGLPELAAFVGFTSPAGSGTLRMGSPLSVVELAEKGSLTVLSKEDWIRELTNQLVGRVKKRFLQFGVLLTASLPSPANQQFVERQGSATTVSKTYLFRTIRGVVVVGLEGEIDGSQLAYCGSVQLPDEGDIILFDRDEKVT